MPGAKADLLEPQTRAGGNARTFMVSSEALRSQRADDLRSVLRVYGGAAARLGGRTGRPWPLCIIASPGRRVYGPGSFRLGGLSPRRKPAVALREDYETMTTTPCLSGCEHPVQSLDGVRLECWSCSDRDVPCQGGCGRPVHGREDGLGADGWCFECWSSSEPEIPSSVVLPQGRIGP